MSLLAELRTSHPSSASTAGGVEFEPRLNLVAGYALFKVQQLCVPAFLVLHPHVPQLIATHVLMLGTMQMRICTPWSMTRLAVQPHSAEIKHVRRPFTQDGTGIRCHLHLIVGASQTDNVIATFITYSASIPVISFQYRFKQSPINMAVCTIRREYSFVVAYMVKSSSWHGSWFAPPRDPPFSCPFRRQPCALCFLLSPSPLPSTSAPGTQVDDAAPPTPHWWLKKRPMSAHENTYDGLRARPLTWDLIFGKVAPARKTGIWQTSTNQFRGESTTAYHWTPLGWGYWRSLPVFLIAI
ncbi:hypothetical protein BGY98DRAFT_936027 [Russula aff. rugulosa BPL654]|nr:hypothetical protein BGY98DRAFT_936027 [Russula aff. rugulosa BPL654]